MEGRDVEKSLRHAVGIGEKLLQHTERIAVANERLIELATEERSVAEQPGPPFCPHCQTLNPDVRNEGGSGLMADFVLVAQCGNCSKMIFAVPESWLIFPDKEGAAKALNEGRKE